MISYLGEILIISAGALFGRVLAAGIGERDSRVLRGWLGASLGAVVGQVLTCCLSRGPLIIGLDVGLVLFPLYHLAIGALAEGVAQLARLRHRGIRPAVARGALLMLVTGGVLFLTCLYVCEVTRPVPVAVPRESKAND